MMTLLGRFSRHLRWKRVHIVALFLLGLAGAASSLATPLIGKTFIDSVVGKQNFALVPRIALVLLGLAIADLILGACTRQVHARLSAKGLKRFKEIHARSHELEDSLAAHGAQRDAGADGGDEQRLLHLRTLQRAERPGGTAAA